MTDVREIPEAIQWHEGMLLAPQHFQQLALRHEALVHYHAYTTAPFYWGVRRLTIDQALLVSGTLRVLELEAIMPDGLIVTHGLRHGRGESALEIDLTPYAHEMTHKPLPVHLAVAAGQGAVAANGALTRYASIEDALNVELHFKHIDDFDPVSVLKQVEPLRKLFEARQRLSDLLTKLDGNDALDALLQEGATDNNSLQELKDQVGSNDAADGEESA